MAMKSRIKLILFNLLLVLTACLLALFLLYEAGGSVETIKNMIDGRDFVRLGQEARGHEKVVQGIGKSADAVKDSMIYAAENAYPPQTPEGAARGISILMYHNVYDPMDPPARINDNYIPTTALEEQLQYLTEEGYSFPTWETVRRYIDGEIDLPEKSVVLTFDDGTDGFRKNGVPLLKKYNVHATAFIIVSKNGEDWVKSKDDYPDLDLESHSYDMHKPGGRIGHGGVMTALTAEQILDDLRMSSQILKTNDAFAYPFGDVDALGTCRSAVEQSGFLVGVTTRYGKARPGMDPYLLPRMRVNGRNSLMAFKTLL